MAANMSGVSLTDWAQAMRVVGGWFRQMRCRRVLLRIAPHPELMGSVADLRSTQRAVALGKYVRPSLGVANRLTALKGESK